MSSHSLITEVHAAIVPAGTYIIEVGCVREEQQFISQDNSTFYFDQMAKKNHLNFMSVDFSKVSHGFAERIVGDRALLGDGEAFLNGFKHTIGILYLDNFDVIYNEKHKMSLMRRVGQAYEDNNEFITNQRSAQVHLNQLKAALPKMSERHFICFDDTMVREGDWWGKGATCVPYLLERGYKIISQSEDGLLLCPGNMV